MGPNIILDKSTFQSLSFDEIVTLHNYYFVVVTPILLNEILGDLTMPKTEDSKIKRIVKLLSKKIQQKDSCITTNHNTLIVNSLLGNKIIMNRKPVVISNNSAILNDGKKGIVIEESTEEIALHRWREGNFTEEEKEMSSRWRKKTTKPNKLKDIQDQFKKSIPHIKFDLGMLKEKMDETILTKHLQTNFLKSLISLLHIDPQTINKIFLRWEQNNIETLKDFSPYAFFCLNLQVFFLQSLGLELVGSKSTNDIDLMYLFYLPFCNIFSSGDKVHKKLIPFFLGKDQSFISAEDLKSDLKQLALEEKKNNGGRKHTPQNPKSFTYKFWEQYVDWFPDELEMVIKLENEESKRIQQIMKELKEQKVTKVDNTIKNSDIEFIQRIIKISPEDLCPCGSGKFFKDCCLSKMRDNLDD